MINKLLNQSTNQPRIMFKTCANFPNMHLQFNTRMWKTCSKFTCTFYPESSLLTSYLILYVPFELATQLLTISKHLSQMLFLPSGKLFVIILLKPSLLSLQRESLLHLTPTSCKGLSSLSCWGRLASMSVFSQTYEYPSYNLGLVPSKC